jgi:hypothetical protein
MILTNERIQAKYERDRAHVAKLAAAGEVRLGALFHRWINQADRFCQVFAVKGTRYAYDYEMPNSGIYVRIGDTATGKERPVSLRALPTWCRAEAEARQS